jgi:hypothetical protein
MPEFKSIYQMMLVDRDTVEEFISKISKDENSKFSNAVCMRCCGLVWDT